MNTPNGTWNIAPGQFVAGVIYVQSAGPAAFWDPNFWRREVAIRGVDFQGPNNVVGAVYTSTSVSVSVVSNREDG